MNKETKPETDKDGFLKNLSDWNKEIAETLARQESIELTTAHWEIINLLREFYLEFDTAPAMRPLCRYIAKNASKEKGNSLYLLSLFPGSPAKLAAKISGLPRPENCL